MSQRKQAIRAIVRHLRRSTGYAAALVERLTDDEVCRIVYHNNNSAAAVPLAAILYQARVRMGDKRVAEAEAERDYAVICKTVPMPGKRQSDENRKPRPKTPGIREVSTAAPPFPD